MSGGIYCEKQKGSFQKNNRFFNGMLYADQSGSAGFFCGRNKKRAMEINGEGIQNIGPAIEVMAANEQLGAHKNAVTVRLKTV